MKPMLKRHNGRPQKFTRGHRHHNTKSIAAQRNNLQQNFERYLSMAREASSTGDRVLAENYYQYAEHYLRTLNEMKPIELENSSNEALNENGEVVAEESDSSMESLSSEDATVEEGEAQPLQN